MIILKLKIKIIALGKIKEKFLKEGVNEFMKRLTPYAS
ncbi:MAG: 23S rRNA (pseudouridine(1915)-N(3))-methyltransferase RlmH, partial [Candidatus Gastranaerophilales bacterium]|nr:23S rRNA (pseudouridine(1915)-N(3))-methyltransferase RlmH [Candidatus Gastranaerophilales bacterium]